MSLDCDRKPSERGYELEINWIGDYPLQYKLLDMSVRVGISEIQLVNIILERFTSPFKNADFPQLVNIILEQNFPFLSDDDELRDLVLSFLCWEISEEYFLQKMIGKNRILKEEDEKLRTIYESGKLGRLAIMEWAPEYAAAFREEVNRILCNKPVEW